MLVGHFAIGLIGKRAAPRVSLGTLVLASMLPDFLGFVFIISGIEHWRMVPGGRGIDSFQLYDIGLSHSLAADVLWAILVAAAFSWRRRDSAGAVMLAVAVVSHWLLDFISHRPDMPLAPGSTRVYGLGLWASLPGTLMVEGGLWLAALIVYVRTTRAMNRAGVYAFWLVVTLLTASWISNFAVSAPPAAQSPVSGSILALGFFSLMVAWAFWMNRLRPASAASMSPR
jgi:membrane-bound metal-dependent hydrolase YbcI (DUF457 family)